MTDQEKLSGRLTPLDISGKPAIEIQPRILELTDFSGNFIEPGSTVRVNKFVLTGVVIASSSLSILDKGTVIAFADANETGHFTVDLSNQLPGHHGYTVRDLYGRESAPWPVNVYDEQIPFIASIQGPDHLYIENGSSTVHNDLRFVGAGAANQIVELMDNGIVVRVLNVDEEKHWSAHLTGLKPGSHKFIARAPNDKESAPWVIEIEKPALLSIQFGYGQGNYQPIKNGEHTTQTAVVLVGTAKPGEAGWILSDVHEKVPFRADEYGVFVALIKDLRPGFSHRFVCRSALEPHRESAPWIIRVESSKLPPQ